MDTVAFCSDDKMKGQGIMPFVIITFGVLPRASGFTQATSFDLCNSLVGGVCPRSGGEKNMVHNHNQFAIATTLTHCLL